MIFLEILQKKINSSKILDKLMLHIMCPISESLFFSDMEIYKNQSHGRKNEYCLYYII